MCLLLDILGLTDCINISIDKLPQNRHDDCTTKNVSGSFAPVSCGFFMPVFQAESGAAILAMAGRESLIQYPQGE
ncbi:hypothetical protein BWD10_03330 [Neisseria zoodegmatis]|uniref:Uncharacterized protein n=1 Tax=Neisseria zoodegmatis TaxID=326523 RepID=A0ABX3WFU5_9NEIS|nr:hypothetical protein BWD10_03330 [Neisseria zoodegmatis]